MDELGWGWPRTASSALPPFILEELSVAELITSVEAALQGRSKHSLSDLGAGTEQSPASHQSWQAGLDGCLAAVDGGRRRREERGEEWGLGGGDRRQETGRRCQKTKRPLTAATPEWRLGLVALCASVPKKRAFELEKTLRRNQRYNGVSIVQSKDRNLYKSNNKNKTEMPRYLCYT